MFVVLRYRDGREPERLESQSITVTLRGRQTLGPLIPAAGELAGERTYGSELESIEFGGHPVPALEQQPETELREFVLDSYYHPVTGERVEKKGKLRVRKEESENVSPRQRETEESTVAASAEEAASQARPAEGGQPKDNRTGRFRREDG